ncbi:transposase [Salicibibacter cibarius]|uniref:Transposase n=2 Tax=Salicibibacter cibarius TaxID=2743000 RepID=A0A7T7CA25_9BACI|nr:transposase [Salicibibacter cibarius]
MTDKAKKPKAIGIDLGISHLAITSDGDLFDNPKHSQYEERKLKHLQRLVSKKKKGSSRRKKAVQLLAKQHERVVNKRRDAAHKTHDSWLTTITSLYLKT